MKIIIFEKNQLFGEMIKNLLEHDHHKVQIISQINKFLEYKNYNKASILLIDADAIEDKIAKIIGYVIKTNIEVKIILMSMNKEYVNNKIFRIDYFIEKPFSYGKLRRIIKDIELEKNILKYFKNTVNKKNILLIINKEIHFANNGFILLDFAKINRNYKIKGDINTIFIIKNLKYISPNAFKKFFYNNISYFMNDNYKFILEFNDEKEKFDSILKNMPKIEDFLITHSYTLIY